MRQVSIQRRGVGITKLKEQGDTVNKNSLRDSSSSGRHHSLYRLRYSSLVQLIPGLSAKICRAGPDERRLEPENSECHDSLERHAQL